MITRDPYTRRTLLFSAATAVVLAVIVTIQFLNAPPSLSPRDAAALLQSDSTTVFLDVRSPEELMTGDGRIGRAIHIPLEGLEERLGELKPYAGRMIIVYCRSGRSSRNATAFLERSGFRARNLEGGILAWKEESLPVIN